MSLLDQKFWDATSFEDGNSTDMSMTSDGAPLLQEENNPSRAFRRFPPSVAKGVSGKFYAPVGGLTIRFRFSSRLYDITQTATLDTNPLYLYFSIRTAPTYPLWYPIGVQVNHPTGPGWREWYVDQFCNTTNFQPPYFGQFSIVRKGDDTRDTNLLQWDVMCTNIEIYT
jgi:hypothetical protein